MRTLFILCVILLFMLMAKSLYDSRERKIEKCYPYKITYIPAKKLPVWLPMETK